MIKNTITLWKLLLWIGILYFGNVSINANKNSIEKQAKNVIQKVFPQSKSLKKHVEFLSKKQKKQFAEKLYFSNKNIKSIFSYYKIHNLQKQVIGYVVLDTRFVRTLPATIMFIFSPSLDVLHIEILKFLEPQDYLPPYGWLEQFYKPAKRYTLYNNIAGITGATLTANAIVQSASKLKIVLEFFVKNK